MTGCLRLCSGAAVSLPPLLEWSIRQTDGDPCGSFSVCFAFEAAWLPVLKQAVGFTAEDGGRTVLTGLVDDFAVRLDRRGALAEVSGRSMAAALMDNQVRAAEFVSAQLADILRLYVKPCGITRIDAAPMGQVANFAVETGYTCWQVLTGFCRHSAEIFPRFAPDGTLVLRKNETPRRVVIEPEQVRACSYVQNRYGAAARQVMVNTRTGEQQVAENAELRKLGIQCTHVSGMTGGGKLRATWRTAAQRLADSARELRQATVQLTGTADILPGDAVELRLPGLGAAEELSVAAVVHCGGDTGVFTTLELR